jgi:hypothetical protein
LIFLLYTWPTLDVLILVFVPPIFSIIYSLLASSYTEGDIVSPFFLMVFNTFVVLGAATIHYRNLLTQMIEGNLVAIIFISVFWVFLAQIFQRFVSYVLGAYGDPKSIQNNIISY